ncbi:Transcription antitermination protein RfaH [Thauera sp. GDN1]|uniref:transcription termination/antitermination protein NusG n=1 Tax=Thauera sp. GDN1 TaxID=2944810 RepID=UPI002479C453|nr:transcription termination/antitermination NusG family protein [Thauera sp. GDN1]WEN42090.1 Transcription antitermination protein RfaH [Thauera sp. GDN1]
MENEMDQNLNLTDAAAPEPAPGPWYVVLTKPRQEHHAAEQLRRQGYTVYLPMHHTWQRRQGVWRCEQAVWFARYLFVSTAGQGRLSVAPIRSTRGVSALVGFGAALAVLPQPVVVHLMQLEAQARRQPADGISPFRPGDAVHIDTGPLAGLGGIVASSARQRVEVLMTLLGQERQVSCSPDLLRRVA